MSAVGHCGDNAVYEGFFSMIKRERTNRMKYPTLGAARADVFDYIKRFHDSLTRCQAAGEAVKFSGVSKPSVKTGKSPRAPEATGRCHRTQQSPNSINSANPRDFYYVRKPSCDVEPPQLVV